MAKIQMVSKNVKTMPNITIMKPENANASNELLFLPATLASCFFALVTYHRGFMTHVGVENGRIKQYYSTVKLKLFSKDSFLEINLVIVQNNLMIM